MLPGTFYYELRWDLLLHLLNSAERLSLGSLCTITSGLGRVARRVAGMMWVTGQELAEDKIIDIRQQWGCREVLNRT